MNPGEQCGCCGRKLPDVTYDMGTSPPLFFKWLGGDGVEIRMDGRTVTLTVNEIEAFLRNIRQHKGTEPWSPHELHQAARLAEL